MGDSYLKAIVAAVLGLVGTAQAAVQVNWATAAQNMGVPLAYATGAPDAVAGAPALEASLFTQNRSYSGLAAATGRSDAQLLAYDLIAWEANGGAPASGGGWESANWLFQAGGRAVSAMFNETNGASTNPEVAFATGSVTGAVYNSLFGTSVAPNEVYSYLLVNLPAYIDATSLGFRAQLVGTGSVPGFGEGTPDPDAIGTLAPVPEPGSLGLLALGLAAVSARVRRRR